MAALVARLWHGLEHAMEARTMRRQLEQLDDRMLKDLGISRAQAEFEANAFAALRYDDTHHSAGHPRA